MGFNKLNYEKGNKNTNKRKGKLGVYKKEKYKNYENN